MIWIVATLLLTLVGATGAWAQGLPAPLAARLAENPDSVLRQAEGIILGHGTGGAIDREGIMNMVAIDRAAARARAMAQLAAADLDADGTVTMDEARVLAATRSANSRGRLLAQAAAADADGDGFILQAELRTMAEAQALRAVSPAREARMLDLLAMDGNGDGALTLAEVQAAVAAATVAAADSGA